MSEWDVVVVIGTALFWVWVGVFVWFFVSSAVHEILRIRRARYSASRAWREGYVQGVQDERRAAARDIPEYRSPGRQNPYGASEGPTRR
jgi:hypothetical protein